MENEKQLPMPLENSNKNLSNQTSLKLTSKQKMILRWMNQCFAAQEVHKTAEQAKELTTMMAVSLEKFNADQINKAFAYWIKTSEVIPTVAGMIKLIEKQEADSAGDIKRWSDFDGTWQEFLAYLDNKGALSVNFELKDGVYKLKPHKERINYDKKYFS